MGCLQIPKPRYMIKRWLSNRENFLIQTQIMHNYISTASCTTGLNPVAHQLGLRTQFSLL